MLTLYFIALALGGTLVIATLVFGAHGDAELEVDADVDLDVDTEADFDAVGAADAVMSWLPASSMRFWTFFMAFFGLTGSIIAGFGMLSSQVVVAAISIAVGYISGFSVVKALRSLRETSADSTVSELDYLGATATVMIAVRKGALGKVRLALKGRDVELLAETEDDSDLAAKQSVVVYAVTDQGHVMVTATSQFNQ